MADITPKNTFKAGDVLTSKDLNDISNSVIANKQSVTQAKEAADTASAAAEAATAAAAQVAADLAANTERDAETLAKANEAKETAQAAAANAAAVAADLQANAAADLETKTELQTTKAALEANAAADAEVKAQVEDNKNAIAANAKADATTAHEIDALKAQIAVLTNVINAKKVGAIAADVTSSVDEQGVIGNGSQDLVITAVSPVTAKTTINGKNVTLQDVNADGGTVIVNASGAVNVTGLVSANVPKSQSNAGVSIHTSDTVYLANSNVNAEYNGIEIGLSAGDTPKDIIIDGLELASKNNAILIFNTVDNANITIRNCTVGQVSEFLRISNRDNVHLNIFLENINIEAVDADLASSWSNIILCQDYTSMSTEAFAQNNRFSPDKIKIYLKNVKLGGQLVTADTPIGPSSEEIGSTLALTIYNYTNEAGKGAFGFIEGTDKTNYPEFIFLD